MTCKRCDVIGCKDPDSKECSDNLVVRYKNALVRIRILYVEDINHCPAYRLADVAEIALFPAARMS